MPKTARRWRPSWRPRLSLGEEIGVADLPIIPAWTVRYPGRGQMTLLTACGDPRLGTRLMFGDLRAFMSEDSPYRQLRVLPHLDHGFPWLDGDIMEAYAGQFASIMCDASEKPFEENIRLTAAFVDKVRGQVVVEGAVDEIFEAGGAGAKRATTVAQARRFLSETGVDIIVPNVGTEHRATADQIVYQSEHAGDQRRRGVHPVPARHVVGQARGLAQAARRRVREDQRLHHAGRPRRPGRGPPGAAKLAGHLGRDQLRELVSGGLPETVLTGQARPRLNIVANPPRRDAWFGAVRQRCIDFLRAFNYAAYAR